MIGSRLVQFLVDAGNEVSVLDDFSRGRVSVEGATYHNDADATSLKSCRKYFNGVDTVYNLAAYVAGVTYNQTHHHEMFLNNLKLQCVPLQAAAEMGVVNFLQVSSVCVYAEDKQNPCKESDIGGEPHAANAGYAWAKRMGERAVAWANIPHAVIVRPANCYGINDYFDDRAHVIPALIKKILHNETIEVNGTGQEVREFLFADDAARGMIVALERGNGIYNIGSDGENSCTIAELVYTLREMLGVDKSITFTGGEGGDSRRIVNGDKLMQLGWEAQMSLQDGLKAVCEWYQK